LYSNFNRKFLKPTLPKYFAGHTSHGFHPFPKYMYNQLEVDGIIFIFYRTRRTRTYISTHYLNITVYNIGKYTLLSSILLYTDTTRNGCFMVDSTSDASKTPQHVCIVHVYTYTFTHITHTSDRLGLDILYRYVQ